MAFYRSERVKDHSFNYTTFIPIVQVVKTALSLLFPDEEHEDDEERKNRKCEHRVRDVTEFEEEYL